MASTGAGYSGTPLSKKLGIKRGHRVLLVSAPAGFGELLDELPEDARVSSRLRGRVAVVAFFPKSAADLRRRLPALRERLEPNGGLWIAWPKKSSGVPTDLDFSTVQTAGLATGLVDNKVCTISDIHSGLRFVIRLTDR